jgi:hypothetical protein
MYRRLIFVEEYIFEMMETKIECCTMLSKRKIGADNPKIHTSLSLKPIKVAHVLQNPNTNHPNTYYSSSSLFSKIQIPIKDISLKQNIVIKFKKTNKHKL